MSRETDSSGHEREAEQWLRAWYIDRPAAQRALVMLLDIVRKEAILQCATIAENTQPPFDDGAYIAKKILALAEPSSCATPKEGT